ncbi:tetratricopeptide repeat protein [Anaeromyxobacter diazotrophicus]|uniref:Tetratricopeptide repeat protein n=1 Tax=Anaeromyxobacter diazotrophicus TaxID=2590199 RepID=A0A7I9VM24_9BACT|nr:hypothetical protein [Anaeromyxobacter diazotrophicus]GEJ57169.1 hypothetical protein AMYX_19100 [Anaeromyxobacter diazotrophicus]
MAPPAAPGPHDPGSPPGDEPVEVDPEDIQEGLPAGRAPGGRGFPRWAKVALALALAAAAALGVYAYRSHQDQRIVELSLARARQLVRADTWLGAQRAADLLGVRAARLDPQRAGSLRALALALLAADFRESPAAAEANALLVEPMRASRVPAEAQLAVAWLALRDGKAGTALEYANRAGPGGLADVISARVALVAGNGAAAAESLERALAADPELPAALALRGDLLRRSGRAADARVAYAAALDASAKALAAGRSGGDAAGDGPHARATFGLAKLALSRELPPEEALAPLRRLAGDAAGSPQVERARAALYLSALQARAGDRAGAAATLEATGLDAGNRAWLQRASGQLEVERDRYRVPDGTPAALVSASDDDPYVPPPPPPPPRVEAPQQQVLHGFKVHDAPRKAPQRGHGAAAKHVKKSAPHAKAKKKAAPRTTRP